MKTIEERAKYIADQFKNNEYFDVRCKDLAGNIAYQSSFISATEQKKIDIDKAWNWILDNYSGAWNNTIFQDEFRKAMED